MKYIFILIVLFSSLIAGKLNEASSHYVASGSVADLAVSNHTLYAATDASCVDIFNLKTKEHLDTIKLEKIKDFMGDIIDASIFSVDVVNNKVLILSQGQNGYSRIYLYQTKKLIPIIKDNDALAIVKVRFLDENTILLALLSDEIISYSIKNKKQNYKVSSSESKFSDFVLNEDKSKVVIADESGDLQMINTKDGVHIKSFEAQNLDDVFQVDYKNNKIATAGKDRRVVIYDAQTKVAYYKTSSFFIYSVGLSPSGNRVAYSSDVNNNITVFNTKTKTTLAEFTGNKAPLSKILFLSENEFLVSSADKIINLYKIK